VKRFPPEKLDEVLPILRGSLAGVSFAFLTGSASEGRAFRDLDVAVWFPQLLSPLDQVHDLATRLERATGVPVDVIPLQKASLGFRHHASKGLLLHCEDEERLAQWREETWGRYVDMEPHFRLFTRELLKPGSGGVQ